MRSYRVVPRLASTHNDRDTKGLPREASVLAPWMAEPSVRGYPPSEIELRSLYISRRLTVRRTYCTLLFQRNLSYPHKIFPASALAAAPTCANSARTTVGDERISFYFSGSKPKPYCASSSRIWFHNVALFSRTSSLGAPEERSSSSSSSHCLSFFKDSLILSDSAC